MVICTQAQAVINRRTFSLKLIFSSNFIVEFNISLNYIKKIYLWIETV